METFKKFTALIRTAALKTEIAYHQAFALWTTHNGTATRAHTITTGYKTALTRIFDIAITLALSPYCTGAS